MFKGLPGIYEPTVQALKIQQNMNFADACKHIRDCQDSIRSKESQEQAVANLAHSGLKVKANIKGISNLILIRIKISLMVPRNRLVVILVVDEVTSQKTATKTLRTVRIVRYPVIQLKNVERKNNHQVMVFNCLYLNVNQIAL